MTRGRRYLASARALMLVTIIAAIGGCSQPEGIDGQGSSGSAPSSVTDLADLPSLEDTEQEMERAVTDIGDRISQVYPDLQFFWHGKTIRSGCFDAYQDTNGVLSRMPSYITERPNLTDEMWSTIYEIVRESAENIGLYSNQVFQDQEGIHVIRFTDETRRSIRLGYVTNLTLAPDTGCRLPEGNG